MNFGQSIGTSGNIGTHGKHTEDTPEAQATLEDLKEQVRQEFRIGPAGIVQDQHLLSSPTTVFRHYRTIPQLPSWILKIQLLAREYASRTIAEQTLQEQQQSNKQNSTASRKFLFDFLRHGHATVSPTFAWSPSQP